jgi:hypothetical protein
MCDIVGVGVILSKHTCTIIAAIIMPNL